MKLIKNVLTLLIIVGGIAFVRTLDTWLFPYPYTYTSSEPPHIFEDFHDITALEITYIFHNDTRTIYRFYKIAAIDGVYYSNMGEKIDSTFVDALAESFTDFYESEYQYSYNDFFILDYSNRFEIVVRRASGRDLLIRSNSDYYCFIPWNIEYNEKTYVQYNGKIPSALLALLMCIDGEYWGFYEKESRWGCYQPVVPEGYSEFSRDFPVTEYRVPVEEERGKEHVLWEVDLHSLLSRPYYYGGSVYITARDRFITLDAETGELLWEVPFEKEGALFPFLTPTENVLIEEGIVHVSAPDSLVYSINSETGEILWTYKTDAHYTLPITAMGENLIVLTGGITCLDRKTGEKIWEITDDTWNEKFFDDTILLESSGEGSDPYYALIDGNTGEIVWKEFLPQVNFPVYSQGILYFSRPSESVFVSIDLETMNEKWSHVYEETLGSVNVFEDKILLLLFDRRNKLLDSLVLLDENGRVTWKYSYAERINWEYSSNADAVLVEDNIIFVRDGGIIEAFSMEEIALWKTEVRGTHVTSFDMYEEYMYLAANDGKIYCLDLKTGQIFWIFAAEYELAAYPDDVYLYVSSIEDGYLFVATNGLLYALQV